MRGGDGRAAKGPADLSEAGFVEPTAPDAAPNGKAVGLELACAHMMVPALVVEDEYAHRVGMPCEQFRIDDEQPGGRDGDAEIGQAGVQNVAHRAAPQ